MTAPALSAAARWVSSQYSLARLLPGKRTLDISYAGLSFIVQRRVCFMYRLESIDERWGRCGCATQGFVFESRAGTLLFPGDRQE